MSNCQHKNPLIRSGSTQEGRQLAALSPTAAKVDDRTISDFILFAKRYAPHIKFYNLQNLEHGNWEAFWERDISAVMATLAEFPIEMMRSFQIGLRNYIISIPQELPAVAQDAALERHFKLLFYIPLIQIKTLTHQLYLLPKQHPLRIELTRLCSIEIQPALERIIAYHKGAVSSITLMDEEIIQPNLFEDPILNITLPAFIQNGLQGNPDFTQAKIQMPYYSDNWAHYYQSIPADNRPFIEEPTSYRQMLDALQYNLFTAAFDRIIEALSKVRQKARVYLDASLREGGDHAANYGLWLAFLRLFKYSQDHLNEYTKRHLEYYYQEVLQLKPLGPQTDQVHVLFELQKNQEQALLPTGTALKAGKDDLGNPVIYQTLHDIVVNKAKVREIKSLFTPNTGFPIAAQKVDTLDGIEEALTDDFPSWNPIFKGAQQGPKARLGLAIADPQLFLREGSRSIIFDFKKTLPGISLSSLQVWYTSEEGWVQAPRPVKISEVVKNTSSSSRTNRNRVRTQTKKFKIDLPPEYPPIIHFDTSLHVDEDHTDAFDTGSPVLKILVTGEYTAWKRFSFSSCSIHISGNAIKNLRIQNKDGVVDTSKPFPLFGAIPDKLPYFILGSSEIFSKRLSSFKVNFEWKEKYVRTGFFYKYNTTTYDLTLNYLTGGKWTTKNKVIENTHHLFEHDQIQNQVDFSTEASEIEIHPTQTLENPVFAPNSVNGFAKIDCDAGFGHDVFVNEKTAALIKKSNPSASYTKSGSINYSKDIPKDPYPAELTSISVDYTTEPASPSQTFHLHPFGFEPITQLKYILPISANAGEFYLGIEGLKPPQRLSLLFQITDGTADPLSDEAEASWSYLYNDQWITTDFEVDDQTDQLTRSGIISFDFPKHAGTAHRRMPSGYTWIRMSIPAELDALNELRAIHAQAVLATFTDQSNDSTFLESPLEAETIKKLDRSIASIKKVIQPYPSFGGRGQESSSQYYTRTSERLRHKNRAVQIWDYEHLILQHFPKIYKVKCLNHTKDNNGLRPGYVSIVCIPKVQSTSKNPLRPYTEKKVILDIQRLIQSKVSPFVKLEVVQPQLEEVQFDFSVAFTSDIADIPFYKDLLNQAIIAYLSPWAFEQGHEISFGGKWYKSQLIDFVDGLPYVDYVKDVRMFHKVNIEQSDRSWRKLDTEIIEGTTARSILVSHPNHLIHPIQSTTSKGAAFSNTVKYRQR